MGDAGEGLVDAESRLAERMEEREQEKRQARLAPSTVDPERARETESLRLAKTEMQRQLDSPRTKCGGRQLAQALSEIDKRLKSLTAK